MPTTLLCSRKDLKKFPFEYFIIERFWALCLISAIRFLWLDQVEFAEVWILSDISSKEQAYWSGPETSGDLTSPWVVKKLEEGEMGEGKHMKWDWSKGRCEQVGGVERSVVMVNWMVKLVFCLTYGEKEKRKPFFE